MHPCGLAIIQAWVASALRNDSLNIEGVLLPHDTKWRSLIRQYVRDGVVIITAAVVINYGRGGNYNGRGGNNYGRGGNIYRRGGNYYGRGGN